MNVRKLVVVISIGVMALVGCGEDQDESSTERPLTTREASMLSEVLVKNLESGGAVFSVATLDRPGGSTVRLEGRLDWVNHLGEASVVVEHGNAPGVIGWRRDAVLERWPDADEVLRAMGTPPAPVIVRQPDIARRLDQIIAVLVGLAGQRPDNAQLVLQTEGSAFLRKDELRGIPVVVMRFGTRNVYWLAVETGEMMRFEARSAEGDVPIVFDVLERGVQKIDLPEQGLWVSVDTIVELYRSLTPAV